MLEGIKLSNVGYHLTVLSRVNYLKLHSNTPAPRQCYAVTKFPFPIYLLEISVLQNVSNAS